MVERWRCRIDMHVLLRDEQKVAQRGRALATRQRYSLGLSPDWSEVGGAAGDGLRRMVVMAAPAHPRASYPHGDVSCLEWRGAGRAPGAGARPSTGKLSSPSSAGRKSFVVSPLTSSGSGGCYCARHSPRRISASRSVERGLQLVRDRSVGERRQPSSPQFSPSTGLFLEARSLADLLCSLLASPYGVAVGRRLAAERRSRPCDHSPCWSVKLGVSCPYRMDLHMGRSRMSLVDSPGIFRDRIGARRKSEELWVQAQRGEVESLERPRSRQLIGIFS